MMCRLQDEIHRLLNRMDHVKQLIQSIRANGGLTDPMLVRDGDLVVLEGNSRLAAYRELARLDAVRWGKAKIRLLPADISEKLVFCATWRVPYHRKEGLGSL